MSATPSRDEALSLLRRMILLRRFEEACAEQYSREKIRGFLHLYIGEEAVAVGSMDALRLDDSVVATYREHAHALLRGLSADCVMAEMFGKATGCARGRGGSMHLFSREKKFFGGYAIVGGGLPIAVGLALADRMEDRHHVTACYFGDGAAEEGEFAESLNLAALWKLPVLFLCENNLYAMGTHVARHASDPDLSRRPEAYGIPAQRVDGMDLLAVREATARAVAAVRSEGRPRFLEFDTYRFRAHSMYDAEKYREKSEVEEWKKRDPIPLFVARAKELGLLRDEDIAPIEASVAAEVAGAIHTAEIAPIEPPEDLTRDVYTEVRS